MHRWSFFVSLLLFAFPLAAQTRRAPPDFLLHAQWNIQELFRDMLDFQSTDQRLTAQLRVTASGAATLSITGTARWRTSSIPVPGSTAQPAREGTASAEDEWSGTATRTNTSIEVRFTRSTRYGTVDVVWTCTQRTIAVQTTNISAYQCFTPQRMTVRAGAGHYVPSYLQAAMQLALPAERLLVRARVDSNANHQAGLSVPSTFERHP